MEEPDARDRKYKTEKVQKALAQLLKSWPELDQLKDRLRTRLSTAVEDLVVPIEEPEELDVFFEELAERSHVWLVAESRRMSATDRVQAVSRLLEITPINFDDLASALEIVRNNSSLFTRGDEGFNDLIQELALKVEQGTHNDDLFGVIAKRQSHEASSRIIESSRFQKLPDAEDRLIKTIGKLLGSPCFAAGSHSPLTRERAMAEFKKNLIATMNADLMEVYLEADYLGISRIPLSKISELISVLYVLSRSKFLELACGTIAEDDVLDDWLFNAEFAGIPASWFLAGKVAEDTAAFAIELAEHYLEVEKKISEVATYFDDELIESVRISFKLDNRGMSALAKTSEQSIRRGKWTVDLAKSALIHDDHPGESIHLPSAARETLWIVFSKIPEGKTRVTFDQREILTEARKRVENLGKARRKQMPARLKDWAFSNNMKALWGTKKLLGSTTQRPEQEDCTGRYLMGRIRIDLNVPFPKL